MLNKNFKTTWCDYLTKCYDRPGIQVGSYECQECPHFVNRKENDTEYYIKASQEKCNMNKYFMIKSTGVVTCKFDERNK